MLKYLSVLSDFKYLSPHFNTESHVAQADVELICSYVAKDDLELLILLPPSLDCTMVPSFCVAGGWTPAFTHARQVLYELLLQVVLRLSMC